MQPAVTQHKKRKDKERVVDRKDHELDTNKKKETKARYLCKGIL